MRVRAAIMAAPRATELRDIDVPAGHEDDGFLRVEAVGVCEFDDQRYRRGDLAPAILGHEIVGTIERAGREATARWGVTVGERVLVDEFIPCWQCPWCARGEYRLCDAAEWNAPLALRYGATPLARAPGLWGGFAEGLHLHLRAVLYPVPENVPTTVAVLAPALANGVQWAVIEGGAAPGKTVLVLGGNRYGIAASLAARKAGADHVLLGVAARELAILPSDIADSVFAIESDDFRDAVMAATTGRGADVVVDTTADTSGHIAGGAVAVAAKGATLVLGGIGIVPLNLGEIRRKFLTLKPVRSHSAAAVRRALAMLGDPEPGFLAGSECFALEDVDLALRSKARHRIVVPS